MLTDLRQKLEPVGRLEVLDGVGLRALSYHAEQDAGDMDADALGRRARAQLLVGEVKELRGDGAGALKAFQSSAAATAELLRREPDVAQRLYDHVQSRFWVGLIAWQRKEPDAAERAFRGYLELAEWLVAMDPDNADWLAEKAGAQSNLAILLEGEGQLEEAGMLQQSALVIERRLSALEPDNMGRARQLGQSWAYVADKLGRRGDYDGAIAARGEESVIYTSILARDPKHAQALDEKVMASIEAANLQFFKPATMAFRLLGSASR